MKRACKQCEITGAGLGPLPGREGGQPEAKTVYVLTLLQCVAHMLPNEHLFSLVNLCHDW